MIKAIKGSPKEWKLDGGDERQMGELEDEHIPGEDDPSVPQAGGRAGEKRSMYLSRRDFGNHGFTDGCPGCRDIGSGRTGPVGCLAGHTKACRKRMEAAIREANPERWQRYLDRRGAEWGDPSFAPGGEAKEWPEGDGGLGAISPTRELDSAGKPQSSSGLALSAIFATQSFSSANPTSIV